MNFSYDFPAVKGIQAEREYYITMVPLKLLSKLFPEEIDVVQPEYRAQRRINETRIPEIRDYILTNRTNYVFSALSASIDGEFQFIETTKGIGRLKIDMDATFLINDGQHRKAAIEAALEEEGSLKDETIAIVFFRDQGLKRSQQMFTDLNKHAIKTSNSLSTLYDSRDSLAMATKVVINEVPFFKKYTDKERDILGKNSSKLFTLNNIYKANMRIVSRSQCEKSDAEFLLKYWTCVANNIVEWNELIEKQITKKALRENYIITLAITLTALGRLGKTFHDFPELEMEKILVGLREIDWSRNNEDDWFGRTVRKNGKVMNSENAVVLTCSRIKTLLGLPLLKEEENKEKTLQKENT